MQNIGNMSNSFRFIVIVESIKNMSSNFTCFTNKTLHSDDSKCCF